MWISIHKYEKHQDSYPPIFDARMFIFTRFYAGFRFRFYTR